MNKEKIVELLNDALLPIGFKRKGNNWVVNGDQISKIVNLQKSQFGNSFYINYGYIIKAIPLDGLNMHVLSRVNSSSINAQNPIGNLLDLGSEISDEVRETELRVILKNKLVDKVKDVNTEEDLLEELKRRPQINDVPFRVKQYFNLS